jgi:hypothetical protein
VIAGISIHALKKQIGSLSVIAIPIIHPCWSGLRTRFSARTPLTERELRRDQARLAAARAQAGGMRVDPGAVWGVGTASLAGHGVDPRPR